MDIEDEIKFLVMVRNKINLLVKKVSIKEPLVEVSAMLGSRIEQLKKDLEL